ncbi:hypothetical protein E2320_011908, partial [Naja naja]
MTLHERWTIQFNVWKNSVRQAENICGASQTCWPEGLGNSLLTLAREEEPAVCGCDSVQRH